MLGNPPYAQGQLQIRRGQQRVRPQPVQLCQVSDDDTVQGINPIPNRDNDPDQDITSDDNVDVEQGAALQQPAQQPLSQAELQTIIQQQIQLQQQQQQQQQQMQFLLETV